MKTINIVSIIIFLLLSKKINSEEENETILFAWEVNRHGARAPYLGVVNGIDAYYEKWIQIEELSDVRKRMLYFHPQHSPCKHECKKQHNLLLRLLPYCYQPLPSYSQTYWHGLRKLPCPNILYRKNNHHHSLI